MKRHCQSLLAINMGANLSDNDLSKEGHPDDQNQDQDGDIIMVRPHIDLELPPEIFEMLDGPGMDPPVATLVAAPQFDGYIYLIREREFINLGQNVYKIGKTSQVGLKRAGQYPKSSVIEIHLRVADYNAAECELIAAFKKQFIHRGDIGAEYFEGDPNLMVEMIYSHRARQCSETPAASVEHKSDALRPLDAAQSRPVDDSMTVLECAFQSIWQYLRHIVSDKYYTPDMEGAFLEHMIFLITGPRGNHMHSDNWTIPISTDQPAPTVNIGKFRTVLGGMFTPGPRKNVTRDQYLRYAAIHNILTQVHPLVVQYESARQVMTRPERYPEIKTSAAIKIDQDIFDEVVKKCIDYKRTKVTTAAGGESTVGQRRSRRQ